MACKWVYHQRSASQECYESMEEVHVWIKKDVQMDTAITYIPPTNTIDKG